MSLHKKEVRITDSYRLQAYKAPTRLMLMTTVRPDVSRPGIVVLGRRTLHYDPRQLTATVDDVSPQLDPLLQGMWGRQMYRLVLTVTSHQLQGTVKLLVN